MKSWNRFERGNRCPHVIWVIGAALMVSLSSGCMSPVTVNLEEESSVSESLARRGLGIDYLSSGRTAMAIRELSASLEMDDSDAQTHLWLGEAYRRKGRAEEAEALFSKAAALATRRTDEVTRQQALLNLSALLAQNGRYAEAIELCEQLSTDPTFSSPWRPLTNCGWAWMQLGRLDEARRDFQEALEYFPRYGPALLNLGILESKEGHRVAAIDALERAIESGRLNSSGLSEANFRLGEIYVGLGRRDKAVEHFDQAVDISPDIDWASQSQAYLDLLR